MSQCLTRYRRADQCCDWCGLRRVLHRSVSSLSGLAVRNAILLIEFVHTQKACMIVRGLRAVSDFEYEFQMVGMNRALDSSIETVFLMAEARHQAIASKLVKEM